MDTKSKIIYVYEYIIMIKKEYNLDKHEIRYFTGINRPIYVSKMIKTMLI